MLDSILKRLSVWSEAYIINSVISPSKNNAWLVLVKVPILNLSNVVVPKSDAISFLKFTLFLFKS